MKMDHRGRAGKRWRTIVALVATLLLLVAIAGYLRWPTRAAEGTALLGSMTRPAPTASIRIGTFNIDGGVGLNGVRDLSRTAGYIRDCDLVGLNEVHGRTLFTQQNQAEILGRSVGLPWLFAPVERQWWHDAFGNAVLTSLPVTHWQRLPLAGDSASSNRNVLLLSIKIGSQPVNVLISHVERGHDHESQLRAVLGLFQLLAPPAILLGDMNTTQIEPQMKQILAIPGVVDAIGQTIPTVAPHVDWILLRGLHTTQGKMQPKGVSDHPFFQADIAVD